MDGETRDEVMILQKAESLCGQPRRNSTGITAAPNLQPPILSRYLRASTGSCHDFCKYGRKHNSEATFNYLKSRRKASTSQDLHNRDMTCNQLEGNEKSVVSVDKSPDFVIVKTDDSWSTQEEDIIVKKAAISGDRCDQDKTSGSLEGKEKSLVNVDESPKSVIVKRDDSLSTRYEEDVIVKKATIYGDLYDQDKTSASLEGKEKSLVNVDESSTSTIVKTDDSLLTPDRDVSFQQPEDPDVTRDLAADLKENSVLPSPSTHVKEGAGDKVHKDTEGALSVAAPKSSSSRKNQKIRSTKAARVSVNKKEKILSSTASIAPERSSRRGSNRETSNYKHAKLMSNQKNCSISRAEPKLSNCDDEAEKTSDFAVADVRNKMAGTAENSLHILDKSPKVERERRSNEKITPQFPPSSGKKKLRCSVSSCGLAKLPPSSDKKNRRRIGRRVDQSPSSSSLLCEDEAEKTSDFAVADVRNKMAGTAGNSIHTLDKSPNAERERRSNEKITPQFPPSSGKKKLRCSASSCGLANLPPSSVKKNRRRIGRHVDQSPSSSSSLLTSLPPTPKSSTSGTSSEHEAAEKGNPEACSNTNRPKRVSKGSSEVKNCQPQNLPFRRGKVVEPRLENVPPRKLRFNRPKLLGECQIGKGDAIRKIFRRKDVDYPEHKSIKSEKIVLKHRHVEKRENVRSLFNNVIEETASKLVETRKSKVKALVGAFETVISLQDTKPKATVAAC